MDGFRQWRDIAESWQYQEKITPAQFEEGYIILCRAGLLDWAELYLNLGEVYQEVTGQEVDEKRLLSLAKEYKRGGYD